MQIFFVPQERRLQPSVKSTKFLLVAYLYKHLAPDGATELQP